MHLDSSVAVVTGAASGIPLSGAAALRIALQGTLRFCGVLRCRGCQDSVCRSRLLALAVLDGQRRSGQPVHHHADDPLRVLRRHTGDAGSHAPTIQGTAQGVDPFLRLHEDSGARRAGQTSRHRNDSLGIGAQRSRWPVPDDPHAGGFPGRCGALPSPDDDVESVHPAAESGVPAQSCEK